MCKDSEYIVLPIHHKKTDSLFETIGHYIDKTENYYFNLAKDSVAYGFVGSIESVLFRNSIAFALSVLA